MAGLTSTGFQLKTLSEILSEIESDELALIDPELDLAPDSAIGQINGIFASKLAEAWELLQTAYGAFDESKAEDTLLDSVAGLTGTYREPATYGTVTLNCALAAGTVLTDSSTVGKLGDDTNRWHLVAAFTAPTTATHPLLFRATRPGPIEALAGTLTVIKTAVAGWTGATNPLDATPGRDVELDPSLRIRRREELRAPGACTVPATYSELLKITGVISARVFENTTMLTNSDGVPPKSVEAVIWDGVSGAAADSDVWQCMYANKPAGIQAKGSVSTTITDATGNAVSVGFSRASQVELTIVLQLAIRTGEFPIDGIAQAKAAIVASGALYTTGQDVYRVAVMALAMVKGVKDVPACTLATPTISAAPANVPIGVRAIATFDTSRITITTVEASV